MLVEKSVHGVPPWQDLVHLDCFSRWIPPNEEGEYPETFECPYMGCLETFSAAEDCGVHVSTVNHPKTNQVDGNNWICVGTLAGKTRFQGARKVGFIACHSGKL